MTQNLFLADNAELSSVAGLTSLTSVQALNVQRCPKLSQCDVDALAQRLEVQCLCVSNGSC